MILITYGENVTDTAIVREVWEDEDAPGQVWMTLTTFGQTSYGADDWVTLVTSL